MADAPVWIRTLTVRLIAGWPVDGSTVCNYIRSSLASDAGWRSLPTKSRTAFWVAVELSSCTLPCVPIAVLFPEIGNDERAGIDAAIAGGWLRRCNCRHEPGVEVGERGHPFVRINRGQPYPEMEKEIL